MATDSTDEQILKGLLDTLVLHVLQAGPNYGFGIREQLDRQFGADAEMVKEATLYPLLHRLERKGLLASHYEPGDRGSPRKYYRLTPEGHAFLDRRVMEWRRVAALLQRTIFLAK
jgi:PadR family transcriptional regulator, regulatory protein PadR